jgi:hypothetical protein
MLLRLIKRNAMKKLGEIKVFFFHVSTALVGLGFLILDVSRSRSDTPQSVGLLRTSHRLVTETSNSQQTLTTDRHPCYRLDSNPQSQQASGQYISIYS